MFDVSWSELLVIAFVAIILTKPEDLPKIIKTLKTFTRSLNSFKSEFFKILKNIEEESGIRDISEDIKIDFEKFSKEYIEPLDKNLISNTTIKKDKKISKLGPRKALKKNQGS